MSLCTYAGCHREGTRPVSAQVERGGEVEPVTFWYCEQHMPGGERELSEYRREAEELVPRDPKWSAIFVLVIVLAGAFVRLMIGLLAWGVLSKLAETQAGLDNARATSWFTGISVAVAYLILQTAVSMTRKRKELR